jgi:hypothetical protein
VMLLAVLALPDLAFHCFSVSTHPRTLLKLLEDELFSFVASQLTSQSSLSTLGEYSQSKL